MSDIGSYSTMDVLEKALPIIAETHRVLANNVANAHTPGFKPTHVSFKESLREALAGTKPTLALKVTHSEHISTPSARKPELVLEREPSAPGRNDASTFDVDREMVEILKNSGRYNIFSAILTKKYQQMREILRMQ